MSFQQGAIDEVYRIILQKIVHSRFAVVFRLWKEEHCQKHDVSLRSKLKASLAAVLQAHVTNLGGDASSSEQSGGGAGA